MAIAARTRPELVIVGTVARSSERTKKNTGEIYGHFHVVETKTGGVQVATFLRQAENGLPVGKLAAMVVSVDDDPTYGSQLTFQRWLEPGDLDLIVSASGLAGK